ncbi:LysE family translocator [Brenneria corticis]|uniref:Lysine transporter LysE n=1 Tax=Brenneria corticis TaxID=2173106 RepID=A0A2U1TLP7_9GAMM|nr:LysE family translocator [Brenneria sp. CFCC 11842]PWC10289.1 lysine transporter LysE [Brenneria sp. CFCC 11842]
MSFGYMGEFLVLAGVHFLAVIAPGPDFAVTIRQAVRFGRKAGIGTAIGIGAGISIHVIYTLFGIGALMHTTPWLMSLAEILGSGYLFYIGCKFIRNAGAYVADAPKEANEISRSVNFRESFSLGFMTNATNPKATLFFLAVFTTLVSSSTPLHIQIFYGLWMCSVNAAWFISVSLIFTNYIIRQRFLRIGGLFERLMGCLLIIFSVRLLWEVVSRLIA